MLSRHSIASIRAAKPSIAFVVLLDIFIAKVVQTERNAKDKPVFLFISEVHRIISNSNP